MNSIKNAEKLFQFDIFHFGPAAAEWFDRARKQ